MAYATLLLDLDHTLLDSDASERQAFAYALAEVGARQPELYFAAYSAINRSLWNRVEEGELPAVVVREARFEELVETTDLKGDPQQLADAFIVGLSEHGELFPGARGVLEQLADRAALGLITNGLGEVQRRRIERLELEPFFQAIVISSEVGVAKPKAAIFDLAFERLGNPSRVASVMVGDSLTSDMRGGTNYGIATCWYNPHGHAPDPDVPVTHEIRDLAELLPLSA